MLIPLLPLAGGLFIILSGRRTGPRLAGAVGMSLMGLASAASLVLAWRMVTAAPGAGGLTAVASGLAAPWAGAITWRVAAGVRGALAMAGVGAASVVVQGLAVRRWPARGGRPPAQFHASVCLLGGALLLWLCGASLAVTMAAVQCAVLAMYLLLSGPLKQTPVGAQVGHTVFAVATAVWRRVDVALIAATVDGVAVVLRGWGGILRRAQTGSVRVYAASALAGLVVMFGFFLWHR